MGTVLGPYLTDTVKIARYLTGTSLTSTSLNVYLTGLGQTLPNGTAIIYPSSILNSQNATKGASVLLDSGTPKNPMPPSVVTAVAEHYPGAEQFWNENWPLWSIPCDAPPGSLDF